MKLLIFASENGEAREHLASLTSGLVQPELVEHFNSLEAFARGLRRPLLSESLALVVASSKQELEELVSLERLLCDLRLILILPDHDRASVVMGHMLRPRFLSFGDGDLTDVAAVLAKMLDINPKDTRKEVSQ